MSDDEWKAEQLKVINDLKLGFRQEQISNEGNDPAVTGESFGTPHDLAALSQQSKDEDDGGDDEQGSPFGESEGGAPEGGFDGAGRPKEGGTYGKDKSPFGRDPLGNKSIDIKPERPSRGYNANEVLNKEHTSAMLSKMKSKRKSSKIITESLKIDDGFVESPLLDEKNIMDSDN